MLRRFFKKKSVEVVAVWLPILGGFQHVKMCASILGPFKAPRGFSSPSISFGLAEFPHVDDRWCSFNVKSEDSHLCQAVPDIKHSAISAKVHQQHGLTSYIMLMLATQGFDLVHLLLSQPVKRASYEFWIRPQSQKRGGSLFRDHKHTQVCHLALWIDVDDDHDPSFP